ncbi:FUSC family protein [Pantoea vagans]|uniref:FUSC family protein n=1 Tax=Pantoea vagans TaxID=470934 RepID=UPI003D16B4EE
MFFLKIEFKKFKIQIKSFWVELLPIFILIIISLILKSYTIKNGYWVIMTFFICLRNDYVNTVARVRSRIIGTLVGCYVGYVFLINVDSELGRVFLSILFSFLAFTFSYNFISKSYMTFTFLVTIMVFLNISLLHNHDVALAYQRLYCSVAGGACALLSTFLKRKATNTNVN